MELLASQTNPLQMIVQGDCLEVMKTYPDNHFSGIVTDPPYGLHFMGKDWDQFSKSKIPNDNRYIKADRLGISGIEQVNQRRNANALSGTYDESRNDEFEDFVYQFGVEALRICKPGAFILMCGAPRRFHRQVCGLEDAGWEIRDCVSWLYGQGFPKSHNHFGLPGFGTALKPAWEPIIMAMKPIEGTFAQNAEKWGQAGINIDASRIGMDDTRNPSSYAMTSKGISGGGFGSGQMSYENKITSGSACGRWPANLILDEEAATMLDEQSGVLKSGEIKPHHKAQQKFNLYNQTFKPLTGVSSPGSQGGASRFFYCAKASSAERNRGLDCYITVKHTNDIGETLCHEGNMAAVELLKKVMSESMEHLNIGVFGESILVQFHQDFSFTIKMKIKQIIESKILNLLMHSLTNEFIQDASSLMGSGGSPAVNVENLSKWLKAITNEKTELAHGVVSVALEMLCLISEEGNWKRKTCTHPTVKPLKLMEYLIKLICPPQGALILDPFAGSGSTLLACKNLGVECIGIEKSTDYCEIARARIQDQVDPQPDLFDWQAHGIRIT